MLISTSTREAEGRIKPITVDGQPYLSHEYIGISPKPGSPGYGVMEAGDDMPQAYLVVQPPHSVTRPHFHQANQFQVFVAGGGTVGKLRADPVTVQYAGGHTPYGPIHAEGEGISYFTLRQRWDSGAKYMPEQRDALERGRQRQRVGVGAPAAGPGTPPTGPGTPPHNGGCAESVLIPAEDDGLLSVRYTVAPGAAATTPDSAAGGGQYHVVLAGTLLRGEQALPPLSVEFASPDEGSVTLQAGPDGLDVLLVRFPR